MSLSVESDDEVLFVHLELDDALLDVADNLVGGGKTCVGVCLGSLGTHLLGCGEIATFELGEVSIGIGKAEGFKLPEAEKVIIPGRDKFTIASAKLSDEAIPRVQLTFSEPLGKVSHGLVSVANCQKYYSSQDENILNIYIENSYSDIINVEIDNAVKSAGGTPLVQAYTLSFPKRGMKPAVEIEADGNIVPDAGNVLLPFRAVNLKAVDIRVIKIYENNVLRFLQENTLSGNSELRRSGRLIYANTVRLDGDPARDLHKWHSYSVDLSGLFKQDPAAIYRVRLSFRQEYSVYGKNVSDDGADLAGFPESALDGQDVWDVPYPYYWDEIDWNIYNWKDRNNPDTPSYYMVSDHFPSVNLMTSDVGLIVKQADADKIWVAATDLVSSDPKSGVEITVYNYQLQKIGSGKTSGSGLAEIPVQGGKPFAVTGHKGNSTSYLRVKNGEQNSLSRFDVGGSKIEKGLKGFVYGERGVWRPGDTLHLTLLLQNKGAKLPDNHPVTMEVYSPEGQFYAKQVNSAGKDGFYRFDQPTSPSDPTGIWNIYFKVGGSTFHKSARVETIKPNRLKINASLARNAAAEKDSLFLFSTIEQ